MGFAGFATGFPRETHAETAFSILSEVRCASLGGSYPAKPSKTNTLFNGNHDEGGGHGRADADADADAAAEQIWPAKRPATGGTTSHARTQLRLASPARSHARTKRNDFPVGPTPPTSDIFIYI